MSRHSALTSYGAPISEYKNAKLNMLKKDFKIDVTQEEENHLNELESEIAIDRYSRTIINNHWKN